MYKNVLCVLCWLVHWRQFCWVSVQKLGIAQNCKRRTKCIDNNFWLVVLETYSQPVSMEICGWEEMAITCPPESFTYIKSAFYGRRPGASRCFSGEIDMRHCLANVTTYISEKYSGYESFKVTGFHSDLRASNHSCASGLQTSLFLNYRCVPGWKITYFCTVFVMSEWCEVPFSPAVDSAV